MRILGSLLLVVLLCVGCSDASPMTTPAPTANEASESEGESSDEVRAAVQLLFDTWDRALEDEDAELFRSVLTREVAESCRLR